jgi:hypothetical protein
MIPRGRRSCTNTSSTTSGSKRQTSRIKRSPRRSRARTRPTSRSSAADSPYGVAYNGEGVTFAQTAGRIIAELMAGEVSELTRLFVVNHAMPYLGPSSIRIVFERLYKWYLTRLGTRTVR